ncbi:MAG: hypothetical protein ABIR91_02645, partial [Candidatus Saccharimonadales bacterium]
MSSEATAVQEKIRCTTMSGLTIERTKEFDALMADADILSATHLTQQALDGLNDECDGDLGLARALHCYLKQRFGVDLYNDEEMVELQLVPAPVCVSA